MSIAFADDTTSGSVTAPIPPDPPPLRAVSPRRRAANRANARKSTGPRTESGKLRSSQNALKHGFYTLSPLLPGEHQVDFDNLEAELRREHRPATATQSHLLHEIACTLWKLHRINPLQRELHHLSIESNPSINPAQNALTTLAQSFLDNPRHNPWLNLDKAHRSTQSLLLRLLKELDRQKKRLPSIPHDPAEPPCPKEHARPYTHRQSHAPPSDHHQEHDPRISPDGVRHSPCESACDNASDATPGREGEILASSPPIPMGSSPPPAASPPPTLSLEIVKRTQHPSPHPRQTKSEITNPIISTLHLPSAITPQHAHAPREQHGRQYQGAVTAKAARALPPRPLSATDDPTPSAFTAQIIMEAVQTRYRTHTCGQLRADHVGQTVKLAGWVHSYRDHGGLVFIDLRDRDGLTQLVFDPDTCGQATHDLSRHLRSEWVISAEGIVERRGAGLENPRLATGQIEVRVRSLEVLSQSPTPPFTPDEHENVSEEKRLQYRFLDLRRSEMQETLRTRARVTKMMRDDLGDLGFWEIETPFLTKSTPEGARDFLVPSRLMPGSFYALPQSPQLFKQLLMVAGCDKYMQIVRCFRDEDPRADRQAEFTQLDVEMAFIDRENIISIMEGLLRRIWKEILGVEIPNPIPHMEYDEAMSTYGSDRPDLRFPMKLTDITDLAHTLEFNVFKTAPMVKCIVVPGGAALTRAQTDALAEWSKGFGAKGLAVTKVTAGGFDTGVAKFVNPIAQKLIERTGAKEGDLLCFAADKPKIVHKVLGELRLKMAKDMQMAPGSQFSFLWVVNFPLFEYDEQEKRYVSTHHPFTAPLDEDLHKLDSRDQAVVESIKSKAYDIVCNGSEIGGGSIRIHRMDIQQKVFSLLGIDAEAQKLKFGFLLDALQFGAPPHGGIALGLDRLIMILRHIHNIRDVIAFPKTQSGADLMCGAPSPVDDRQLKEANIRAILPPGKTPHNPLTPDVHGVVHKDVGRVNP